MRSLRKKATRIVVAVAVAAGVGVGVAGPANAAGPAVPSYYPTQAACQSALAQTGRNDLVCNRTIGRPSSEAWVLSVPAG
ncbi:hypothetical protein ACIOEX_04060 [Streptomyces sp. NPDC087850]|uniref:hypothetical protein n=1 Tax=Streptomyces sp. NPDC087850 TaxID=3365809 RepID=UPI00382F1AA1